MTKALAYLRVSGKAQVEGDGFERQLATIERYAELNGIEIEDVFQDEGVSGTLDLENRPAFLSMLEAMSGDGVETIVIERLDRLARDLMVQESIIADMTKRGITVVSALEPDLCSVDPTRVLIRQLLGAFAQYEKSMIVSKLRVARQRKKGREGRCEGEKPFGENPRFPAEPKVLEEILGLAASGQNATEIARYLNAAGIAPRKGEKWAPFTVSRILKRAT